MRRILAYLFVVLYLLVGVVSTYHSTSFFNMANELWASISLAVAAEATMIASLLYMLLTKSRRKAPWLLMSICTILQILGNLTASYQYLPTNSSESVHFFAEAVFLPTDVFTSRIVLSYIIGAVLPILSLGMTELVVDAFSSPPKPKPKNKMDMPAPDFS